MAGRGGRGCRGGRARVDGVKAGGSQRGGVSGTAVRGGYVGAAGCVGAADAGHG